MKVETAELPDSEVALSLEIDDVRLQRALDAAYRRAAGKVTIAGFRRGKAPRPLVERVVGREALLEDALGQLLPEVFSEAVEETQIRPVMEPEFDVESLSPLRAKATVVVEPAVTLGDYRAIQKEATPATIGPETVDAAVDALRQRHAEWVPVERAAMIGDLVTLNARGEAGEVTVFRREEIDYLLETPSQGPVPGFAEQIVGMVAGEDGAFDLPVPEEEGWGSLAGQTVAFHVSVLDVKEKELPELDDAFAETLGHGDVAGLREHVEGQLREGAETAARRTLEQEVLDEALLFCMVKVPQKLIEQQAARAYERLGRDLDSRGLTTEQYLRMRATSDEVLRAELRTDAERSLKRRFVLQRIAAEEGLVVEDQEVADEIRQILAVASAQDQGLRQTLQAERARQSVRASLVENKAAAWLFQNATSPVPSLVGSLADSDGEQQS